MRVETESSVPKQIGTLCKLFDMPLASSRKTPLRATVNAGSIELVVGVSKAADAVVSASDGNVA